MLGELWPERGRERRERARVRPTSTITRDDDEASSVLCDRNSNPATNSRQWYVGQAARRQQKSASATDCPSLPSSERASPAAAPLDCSDAEHLGTGIAAPIVARRVRLAAVVAAARSHRLAPVVVPYSSRMRARPGDRHQGAYPQERRRAHKIGPQREARVHGSVFRTQNSAGGGRVRAPLGRARVRSGRTTTGSSHFPVQR